MTIIVLSLEFPSTIKTSVIKDGMFSRTWLMVCSSFRVQMIAVILGKGAWFRVEFWVSDGDFMESRDPNQSSWESKQGLVGIGS